MKRAATLILALALLGTLTTGCFRHQYGSPTPPPGPPTAAKWNHHILFGIIALDSYVDPDAVCDGRAEHVSTYVGPLGLLAGILTAGIWVPTTTTVWCAGR